MCTRRTDAERARYHRHRRFAAPAASTMTSASTPTSFVPWFGAHKERSLHSSVSALLALVGVAQVATVVGYGHGTAS